MSQNYLNKILYTLLCTTLSLKAQAGGVILYEIGSDDIGLASAGYSARAQDPSTIYTNPAGMTRLQGNQTFIGVQGLYEDIDFNINSASPFLGFESGGNPIKAFPGGSFFYNQSITENFKIGLGIYGNFGAVIKYDGDWVGRYTAVKDTLIGSSIQPTLAYRVNEKLSLGAGPVFMYGILRSKTRINNSPFQLFNFHDSELSLSAREWGYGVNLGALYEFNPCTRIGVTYTSQIKLNFSSTATFTDNSPSLNFILRRNGLLDAEVDIGIKVPQTIMGSIYHQFSPTWAFLGSIGWQAWSKFGKVDVGIDSTDPISLTINRNYKNTWHGAAGFQHQISAFWLLNFGIGYDSRFQDSANVSIAAPANSAWRFGIGTKHSMLKCLDVGAAFEYIYGGNLDVNSHGPIKGDIVGQFANVGVYFLGVNATYKFG
ncbi:MAG: outer membrane protein transport protein [Proteobacteria bacterium]|nr:outer membrane protein transport protein [Pseudomonadota bacterium]